LKNTDNLTISVIDTHAFTGVVLVGTNFVCPDGNMLSSPPSQVGSSRYIKAVWLIASMSGICPKYGKK